MDSYIVQQTLGGRYFIGSTTYDGVIIPAHDATAQVFGLWNPAGSQTNLVLDRLTLGLQAAGTEAISTFGLSYLTNTDSDVATGGQITAFTQTTPVNGLLGGGNGKAQSPRGRFTLSATTSAPTHFYCLGMCSIDSDFTAAGTSAFVQLTHDFGGGLIIPPGVYVGLGRSAATANQKIQASINWFEVAA